MWQREQHRPRRAGANEEHREGTRERVARDTETQPVPRTREPQRQPANILPCVAVGETRLRDRGRCTPSSCKVCGRNPLLRTGCQHGGPRGHRLPAPRATEPPPLRRAPTLPPPPVPVPRFCSCNTTAALPPKGTEAPAGGPQGRAASRPRVSRSHPQPLCTGHTPMVPSQGGWLHLSLATAGVTVHRHCHVHAHPNLQRRGAGPVGATPPGGWLLPAPCAQAETNQTREVPSTEPGTGRQSPMRRESQRQCLAAAGEAQDDTHQKAIIGSKNKNFHLTCDKQNKQNSEPMRKDGREGISQNSILTGQKGSNRHHSFPGTWSTEPSYL